MKIRVVFFKETMALCAWNQTVFFDPLPHFQHASLMVKELALFFTRPFFKWWNKSEIGRHGLKILA